MSHVHMVQVMSPKRFEISKESCVFSWFSSWMMIILYNRIPCVYQKSNPKQRQKKEWCKKDHQSQNSENCRRCHANHTMKSLNNAEKQLYIYKKKHTQIIQKSLTVVGKQIFPKFKSPLQPTAVESPHCTISNWPQWYGGALGNDSTRFNCITVVEALWHGIGASKKMWSIMTKVTFYHKKASDIISDILFKGCASNLYTWIHFCWE